MCSRFLESRKSSLAAKPPVDHDKTQSDVSNRTFGTKDTLNVEQSTSRVFVPALDILPAEVQLMIWQEVRGPEPRKHYGRIPLSSTLCRSCGSGKEYIGRKRKLGGRTIHNISRKTVLIPNAPLLLCKAVNTMWTELEGNNALYTFRLNFSNLESPTVKDMQRRHVKLNVQVDKVWTSQQDAHEDRMRIIHIFDQLGSKQFALTRRLEFVIYTERVTREHNWWDILNLPRPSPEFVSKSGAVNDLSNLPSNQVYPSIDEVGVVLCSKSRITHDSPLFTTITAQLNSFFSCFPDLTQLEAVTLDHTRDIGDEDKLDSINKLRHGLKSCSPNLGSMIFARFTYDPKCTGAKEYGKQRTRTGAECWLPIGSRIEIRCWNTADDVWCGECGRKDS